MQLNSLDWWVVAACVLLVFVPALLMARRGGRSTAEFFASGRAAPWWLVGTSMVATTFATDTPGLVTELVREQGVAKNWMWWSFLLTGMATVFFYARLWRRSGVLTDLEFYEIRYSGRPAALVRGFRAVYLGLIFNCFIMATVTLAAVKIASTLLGAPPWLTVSVCAALCIVVSAASGLWGVLVSDLIQFGIALSGAIVAAYYAVTHPDVGGLAALVERVPPASISMLPVFSDWRTTLTIFIIPLTVTWWSVWYPGSEPGGGSYVAQRMLAARNERHAAGATLWFNVAHYALRPWPWILVALASMLVFPQLSDIHEALPHIDEKLLKHDVAYPAMLTLIPPGLLGLVVASLLAAYVSTMSTHLNWGASYLVNDLYVRFIDPKSPESRLVLMSRVVTVGLMLIAGWLSFQLESARHGFEIIISIGAGTGLLYLLRWFWWRINAWSEIAAMVGSFGISVALMGVNGWLKGRAVSGPGLEKLQGAGVLDFDKTAGVFLISAPVALLITVLLTTAIWLSVTFLTRPTARERLIEFWKLTQPAGPGWRQVRSWGNLPRSSDSLTVSLLCWVLGCGAVYSALFGAGSLIFGATTQSVTLLGAFALCSAVLIALVVRAWGSPRLPASPTE